MTLNKPTAAITGVHGYVPDYVLTNKELEKLVDTTEEWIVSRTGILERRIQKGEGLGTSDLAVPAIKALLEKTNTNPLDIELIIFSTATPDMQFPATANIAADKSGLTNAAGFDISAACSGFLFALTTAAKYIEAGMYKKIIVAGFDKMSSIVDYTERSTCILFGDGGGAVLLEPNYEGYGLIDSIMRSDGSGRHYLHQKAGGSVKPASLETLARKEHFIYQEGQSVFKFAVTNMANAAYDVMSRNGLTADNVDWLVPHQANKRIIDATSNRMGLSDEKVMINIHKYGNTTCGTIPLCLFDYEKQLKKGDNVILAAFGGGFTWGATYIKWAYDSK